MIEANRAAVAAFSDSPGQETPAEEQVTPDSALMEWDIDCSIQREGTLSVGDTIQFSKTLTDRDVTRFATASGDTNPIHLDEERAEETRFDGRIVHGTLVAGLISAALARLPGDVIYLSQDTEFLGPIRIGERATAVVEVTEEYGDGRYRLTTQILDPDEEIAIDGEATILIDDPPK
jgi:3-hydroxybutyryl-CoA dehydratase